MKKNRSKRIVATITLIAIAIILVYFVYAAITGTNFAGAVFLLFVVPLIVWAIMFFGGAFSNNTQIDEETQDKEEQ